MTKMIKEERTLRQLFQKTENDTADISSIPISRRGVSRYIRAMRRALVEKCAKAVEREKDYDCLHDENHPCHLCEVLIDAAYVIRKMK